TRSRSALISPLPPCCVSWSRCLAVPKAGLVRTATAEGTSRVDEAGMQRAEAHHGGASAVPERPVGAAADAAPRPDGTVTGVPRRWLRLEGTVLVAGALIAYSATGQPWWLVPLALLVPDVLMVG